MPLGSEVDLASYTRSLQFPMLLNPCAKIIPSFREHDCPWQWKVLDTETFTKNPFIKSSAQCFSAQLKLSILSPNLKNLELLGKLI